jgi:nicotinate dehydrogenase subunit B
MNAPTLTRRGFTTGMGGLVLAFSLDPAELLAQGAAARLPGSLNNNRLLQAWVRIGGDGSATVYTGKVELGQGILTALWQIAAEELDLSPSRVRIYSADTALSPDEGQTAGSQSIENSGTALRLACAEVRGMLVDAAAVKLAVPASSLNVADGVIMTADRLKVTYAEAIAELDLNREASGKVAPKPVSAHKIVGQPTPRLDIPGKVTGRISYVQDIFEAGMVHGRVVRPPRYGSTLESVDEAAVSNMTGVIKVVRDGSFLGVVAEREEQAVKAREALARAAKWKLGPELPDPANIHAHLKSLPNKPEVIGVKQGAALAAAGSRTLEATYTKPYLAHGSIGPSCAVATFLNGRMIVWTHSQGVFPLRNELAKALKLPAKDIRCIHVEGSGCYGQNGADDVAMDAALLARAVPDKPVRLQWMRDDEFAWEPFGPAMSMSIKASLDTDGQIGDWQYQVWSNTHSMRPESTDGANLLAAWYMAEPHMHGEPKGIPQPAGGGDRNAIPLYEFPNQKVVHHFIPEMPIRVSALRTLGAYANVFAIECFMDEMAALAKADPVAFRLAHLKDPRAKAVIEKVATMANWKPGEAGSRGRGVGFAKYKNLATYVAVIADVEIDRASGNVRVPRIWAAADSGLIINPDGLRNQIEGGILQSTSWTLYEQVRFDKNGIRSRDWESYPIMTMPDVPKVTVELINRPGERPLGAGEASQGPTVAAIANAVAHATGKRLRDLPLDAGRVKAALG